MRLLLLVVLLTGCSSSAPSAYQRGTFTAPPPAPTRPGVGLPAYGDPGTQGHQYPRSPYRRELPPSSDQGLWSGSPAMSAHAEETNQILGVTIPIPTEYAEIIPTATCVVMTNKALDRMHDVRALLMRSGERQRQCIVYQTQTACLLELLSYMESKSSQGIKGAEEAAAAARRIYHQAKEREAKACRHVPLSEEETDAETRLSVQVARDIDVMQRAYGRGVKQ